MNPIDLIPLPYRIAAMAFIVLGAAALATGAVLHYGHGRYEAGKQEVTAKWDAERQKQTAAALAESQSNAKETQRRLERQGDAQRVHDQEIFAARNDAATARVAGDSLRQWAEGIASAARRAASNPADGCDCKAADDSARVLADVLRKSDERSGVLAEYADSARIAGQQCVRDYEALSKPR
jgi:hypothetical protein